MTVRELITRLLAECDSVREEVAVDAPTTLDAGAVEDVYCMMDDGGRFVVLRVSADKLGRRRRPSDRPS